MKDPMGLLESAANDAIEQAYVDEDEIEVDRDSFLLRKGDAMQVYNRIYKVVMINDKTGKIILKRVTK